MNEKDNIERDYSIESDALMRLMIEQSRQTSQDVKSLAASVQSLVMIEARREENKKTEDARYQRQELEISAIREDQKELSRDVLILTKDAERSQDFRDLVIKILTGIFTTIIAAAIIAGYVSTK